MKIKLAIDLPDRAKYVAGLTPRDVHPQLVRAEQAALDAEQAFERARAELAEHERIVAALPARIQAGELPVRALTDALRDRDARALLVEPAEQAVAAARARVAAEERNAVGARDREINRRVEILERAAAEISPVLEEIYELSRALALAVDPAAIGGLPTIDWPLSPHMAIYLHQVRATMTLGDSAPGGVR